MRESGRVPDFPKDMILISDASTARTLPAGYRLFVFRLIADSSISELREFSEGLS